MPNLHTLHPDRQFTQVSNDAADRLPDLASLGYLVHLLRHRDGYVPNLERLVKNKAGVGRESAARARKIVMRHGYRVDVRFQHTDGNRFCTDVWRTVHPHTEDDLAEIAKRYAPGNIAQLPQLDSAGNPTRDAQGNVCMRQVVIKWAALDTSGESGALRRVAADGQLSTGANSAASRGTETRHSGRPAKTGVCPGGPGVRVSGYSGSRVPGEPYPLKNTTENTPISGPSIEEDSSPSVPLSSTGAPAREGSEADGPSLDTQTETGDTQKPPQQTHTASPTTRPMEAPERPLKTSHGDTQAATGPKSGQSVPPAAAARVVADPTLAGELARIDLRERQGDQLRAEVARALLRFPEAKVRDYLHSKARQARTVKFLLDAFRVYGDAIKDMPTEPDHNTDASEAVVEQLATAARSVDSEPAGPSVSSLTRCVRPKPEPNLTSPVPWLTNADHAALSPQDRAAVRLSTQPNAPARITRRVATIRAQHDTATAA